MSPEVCTIANDGVTIVAVARNGESVRIRLSHGPVSIMASVDRTVLMALLEASAAERLA